MKRASCTPEMSPSVAGPADPELVGTNSIVVGDDVEEGSGCTLCGPHDRVGVVFLIRDDCPVNRWFSTTRNQVGTSYIVRG